ncbi:hypothetical protein [Paractinoplanes rishiriensis]|uniref:Uncharacterized protein n=1 Tax=Paractinoplanes rishiriensis TaxID=1050105 RepID=A0A919K2A6_9ACTN|nr:hypothetical protein [Actinoplanes rishiriensis]GIE98953.1 hypothetical protein Ari01nite_64180 [Actinoplanes rishiriensis]
MNTDVVDAGVRTLAEQISNGQTTPEAVLPDGVILGVRILPDRDAHPSDYDEYGPADLDAFRDGEWRFVGLRVVVNPGPAEIASNGVWAVELGRTEGDIETGYLQDLIHCELAGITEQLPPADVALVEALTR